MERIKLLVLAVLAIGDQLLGSESGFVAPRRILPVAWTVGVVLAAAVALGTPGKARAELCIADYYFMYPCEPSVCSTYCLIYHDCTMSTCLGSGVDQWCYCYDYVK